MVRIGSLIPTLRSSLLIKIVIELRGRDAQRRTTYFRSWRDVVVDRGREGERRQPQLKIIYFEAYYPSSFFKTMTCQTGRHHRWIYMFVVERTEGKSKMILSMNLEKKRDWLNSTYLIRFCSYLSFSFLVSLCVYIYIYKNIDFLFSPPLPKKIDWRDRETNDIKEFRRVNERASTNDHFCRQRRGRRREREREHDFCCPHNYIKRIGKKSSSSVIPRYARY